MSLKKIAQLAGTSVSTVSRVLNQPQHQCHDQELKNRIWEAAREVGYTPDVSARNLRMGISATQDPYTVDVFLTRFDSVQNDAFFSELLQIIREELLKNNCIFGELFTSMDIAALNHTEPSARHIPYRTQDKIMSEGAGMSPAFVTSKKNTGLIILGKLSDNLLSHLRMRYSCMVGIDRNPTNYLYDEVFCNGATATQKAIEYLISLGHRRIGYMGDCNYESRYLGYYQTLLESKLPLHPNYVYPTNQTEAEGFDAMCRILEQKDRPSAIFCANDTTALGVLRALKSKRHKNYQPSIISIDDIEAAALATPALTTISIPKQQMGHLALTMLLDRRNGGHTENIRMELNCHLIVRESCSYCYE